MILTDTSVVVDYLRNPTKRMRQIIQNNQAAICGVTVSEIFAGGRNSVDFRRFTTALGVFGSIAIRKSLWSSLGRNLAALRRSGATVPFTDALIATLAIDEGRELWTYDSHFVLIQRILPQLVLFHEPP